MSLSGIFSGIKKLVEIPIFIIPRLGKIATGVVDGLEDIFNGVVQEFEEFPKGAWYTVLDLSVLFQYTGTFLLSNFLCAMKAMSNIKSCFMFYLIEMMGTIMYSPIAIFIFILSLFRIPSYSWEKQFWDKMEVFDQFVYNYCQFHIIHYPKSIRETCYNCVRLKPTVFAQYISEFINDVEDPIFGLLFGGLEKMFSGFLNMLMAVIGG